MLTRREFLKYSVVALPGLQLTACGGDGSTPQTVAWPITRDVFTTAEQQIHPQGLPADTPLIDPPDLPYSQYGYSAWQTGPGLAHVKRTDLAPGYSGAPKVARLLSFFAITDIHIADKESPAQPLYIGWSARYGAPGSCGSAYSPVILSTTQVLDAAIQTVNALHKKSPIDFGISLGDDTNNSQYNELRWFIDVLDGKRIAPSSGAHIGADHIDYQKPFQAAGLDPAIPWYQVVGNHDQFWMGSAYENAKTWSAHVGSAILNMSNSPDPSSGGVNGSGYYMGVVDGANPYGFVIGSGPQGAFSTPPTVVADPARRSLATSTSSTLNWMREFFETTSNPPGHGFKQSNLDADFACYSFEPKANMPIKVIALDNTMKGADQTEYARACLDQTRLDWLKAELQDGQDRDKLMIIAAHIPLYPQKTFDPAAGNYKLFTSPSVVTDLQLLTILHTYPNLILWISGHRHVNVVTPQQYNGADPADQPEKNFWEVETASLRDFPQQFRTFEIHRNADNTVSIMVTNVDPAVSPGSPAAKSRAYAVGAARIFAANDSVRADTGSQAYNAELVQQLTPRMQAIIAGL